MQELLALVELRGRWKMIRNGIIPCTHAGALNMIEDVELVAGSARTLQSAQAFQERFHTRKAYTNYLEMVREEKLDIVGVCTNPETHADIVVGLG